MPLSSSLLPEIRGAAIAPTNGSHDMTRLVVIAPTFYSDTSDIRYLLGLESCRKAAEYGIEFILVDASPSQTIRDALEQAGRSGGGHSFVRVLQQSSKGKKGAALREGISHAVEQLREGSDGNNNQQKQTKSMIGFQELEKVDLIRHWKLIASHANELNADVVVPRREDKYFRESYPIEQYHSEQFGNMFLNALGKKIGFPSIDWLNGPFAFDVSMANSWLENDGEIWDAQLVPMVDCFLKHKASFVSFEIPYVHPSTMKEEEEGNVTFIEKRLYQVNSLTNKVGKLMKDAAVAATK